MSQIPVQTFLFPILAIIAVVFILMNRKKMMGKMDQENAKCRLSEVAQRMRLSIVEGDPSFNLMLATTTHEMKRLERKGGIRGAIKPRDRLRHSR